MSEITATDMRTESVANFRTANGIEARGTVLRLTPQVAVIEICTPDQILRSSEVLEDFKLLIRDRVIYSGKALVREFLNPGTSQICSVLLDDYCFNNEFFTALSQPGNLRQCFRDFIGSWQKVCTVRADYKVAVADIVTFLLDLRRWMEQVELGIRASPSADGSVQERAALDAVTPEAIPVLDELFGKFEAIAAQLSAEEQPAHRGYIQRHLHPIVLCAPFAYRSYRKPLGYAGDYEIVNMMARDPQEGSSLFAKLFNVWLLQQGSATAHRNRLVFLKRRLVEETAAAVRAGRPARILNLGCGPAIEIQEFLAESELSDHVQFTLMDFNDETLQHTSRVLREKQQRHQRKTKVTLVKKSVQQLLKDVARGDGLARGTVYDFVYCAGLFDYLPDRTCKRLMGLFYQSVRPGGLVLSTNVAPTCPNRGSLELVLDWHLIYRNAREMENIWPREISPDPARIESDETFVNVFLEARKPNAT